jgi:very-short-patch-repair endonuclease
VKANDEIRQKRLEMTGFIVIGFKDEEVLKEIGSVRNIILKTIREIEAGDNILPFAPQRGIY